MLEIIILIQIQIITWFKPCFLYIILNCVHNLVGEKMNIDIRNSIKDNFKDSSNDEIIESIESAIKDSDEITLPGLGVFLEILWKNSNGDEKTRIVDKIKKGL